MRNTSNEPSSSLIDGRHLHRRLSALREEYRGEMNRCGDRAQVAAAADDMKLCSLSSTVAARFQEAFTALNRAAALVELALDEAAENTSASDALAPACNA